MPPPVPTQSGSKAALITWTVITSILFVVSTVLAIFAHVEKNKLILEREARDKQVAVFLNDGDLNGDLKDRLIAAQQANKEYANLKLVNVALEQRDALVRKIAGASAASDAGADARALIAAEDAIKDAKDKSGKAGDKINPGTDHLVAVLRLVSDEVAAQTSKLQSTEAARDAVSKQLASLQDAQKKQLDARDADIARAVAEKNKYQTDASSDRSAKDKQIEELRAKSDEQAKLAQDDMNKLQAQIQELNNQIKKSQDQVRGLQARLRDLRQPVNQVVKQADATIMRTATDNIVYINLGAGDQVTPGMSFEVFDRLEGIPAPGDPTNNENLPKGKASIEIVRVSPGSSECRIVRSTPGATVVDGDLCVNLVYDKAVKYNFVVYGNFDLDRNGQTSPTDADVIKRLITSWGGGVMDKLNVDTDFLVIGKLPEIPNYTQEELDRPEIQFDLERKKKELADYEEILARAIELNIPILNQNRFLYFVGYYEQSAR